MYSRRRRWGFPLLVFSAALLMGGNTVVAQVKSSTPAMGFLKVTIKGDNATSSGDNFIGPSFVTETEYQGTLDAGKPGPNVLPDAGATWASDQFDTHSDSAVASHYVEILSAANSAAVGMITDIASHSTNVLTTVDDLSGYLDGGETFAIRKHSTLSSLFGAANEVGLGEGTNIQADLISVLDAGSAASFRTYYYRNSTLGGTGWRSTTNPFTDEADRPIRPDEGLYIRRNQSADLTFVMHGYVHEGRSKVALEPGLNIVNLLTPITDQTAAIPASGPKVTIGGADSVTRRASGLESIVAAGSTVTADTIAIFDGASTFRSYYFKDASVPLGGTGWRLTTDPFTDQQAAPIPAGGVLLIRNEGGVTKFWDRPQMFDLPAP